MRCDIIAMAMPLINEQIHLADIECAKRKYLCASVSYWHGVVRLNYIEWADNFEDAEQVAKMHTELASYVIAEVVRIGDTIHINKAKFA